MFPGADSGSNGAMRSSPGQQMPVDANPPRRPLHFLAAAGRAGSALLCRGLRAARERAPGLWNNLRSALAGRQWLDRATVLAFAAFTGLVVVGFTLLAEACLHAFNQLQGWGTHGRYIVLLWTPLITVAVLWWTRRFAPGTAGSGIPQVVRALDDDLPPPLRSMVVSLRLSLHKIGLVSAGLLAGLSIGREGPTVQVGAGAMVSARRWLSPGTRIDEHDLMVAGAAAGIAAAFNTPLGGIVFALEQLSRRRGTTHTTLVIASIVLAGLVAVAVFGNVTYFGRLRVQELSGSLLLPGLLVALVSGLAGGLFARLIVMSLRGTHGPVSRWRGAHPFRFAALCGLAVALIGFVTSGATAGAGYSATKALLEGEAELPGVYTLLKFCATWISAWSGVPAGVFAPSLAIGAGIGHDIALVSGLSEQAAIPLIALGMAGFLAATTAGPITAFIIVMEMVAGQAMVLSLMACALLANGVGRMVARPMYWELAAVMLPTDAGATTPGARTPDDGKQR
jgi:H+/Cl- antiporter ClcA